ncbi:DUF6427 family protein [Parapedobacter indicus]|uniref:Beta-carotene 15,15'-monooxygenase n=1 Tax=Parapedobacter indicus TaxID=1477437 RepID=A0A1I3GY23_9SPHI|nr:DUF6427 family protein [Parapedobacter indicus]PPL02822.1 hypothetical protein CLV26_103148 [Parapedobacter indicus]SFI28207.1 hypothetical protein SAMN05444682_103147 [Parapedobacter indicus]
MIDQFRKYTPLNILLLSLIGLMLCLGVFMHLPRNLMPVFFEPAIANFTGKLSPENITPQANVLITLVLTVVQALLINRAVNQFNLVGRSSFLPALMYMTLASLMLPFLVLSPILICNFLSIWMLDKLFSIYRRTEIKPLMFDLGMIVALGSLVYFPFIVMLLLLWCSLIIFRPFNWREWLAAPIGFATVYFLLGVVYLWFDRMTEFYEIWLPLTSPFPTSIHIDIYDYLVLLPVIIILVLFFFSLRQNLFKSVVHIRKSFQLLFCMFVLSFISFYLNADWSINHFLLTVPPVAVYMTYYFNYATRRWFYESVYALLVLTIIYFQFF